MDTIMTRVVLPEFTNQYKNLFGGQALKWMDEIAFIFVLREFKKDFVTVKVNSVAFLKPVPQGEVIEFKAGVLSKGNVKVEISVQGFILSEGNQELAIDGVFTLAPVTKGMRPTRL
ncbi:MAG: acyl-CoA thioesterase [Bacteroidales bacterium]|jgi:acyl-CoA hydrolase|nr:acyl-CoA thioesterase [Bacteroidales bacterium]MDD4385063.1 acyl-CoA thioesterase [Bacteroidales bacterium]MDY0196290.1 acyl-CoA thioesterase [Tenuifilaceae bacterium]